MIPKDNPLYRNLLELKAPKKFLRLVQLFTETSQQEAELLAWLEITGESDLQSIADHMFEVTNPDRHAV